MVDQQLRDDRQIIYGENVEYVFSIHDWSLYSLFISTPLKIKEGTNKYSPKKTIKRGGRVRMHPGVRDGIYFR